MSVAEQSILDYKKIIQIANQKQETPLATNGKELLGFLVSDTNRTSLNSPINLLQAKQQLALMSEGELGKTAVFETKPLFNPRKRNFSLQNLGIDECNFSGEQTRPKVKAQLSLNRNIKATRDFTPNICSPSEPIEIQLANTMRELYEEFNYDAYAFVISEITRKDANGKFIHIGNNPGRNADFSNPPGKVVNIFMADGLTPNRADIIGLQQEMINAGIRDNDAFSFGDARWDSFARTITNYNLGDSTGFNFSALRVPFLNQAAFMMNTDVATAFRQAGIDQALMVLKTGMVQFITAPYWENPVLQGNFNGQLRSVITVPGFGIKADLTVNIDKCAKVPTWHFKLETRAALFTVPGCIAEALSDDFLQDYNGVMVYSGGCGDSTFCDQPDFTRVIQDTSAPLQDCEVQETVCDTPTTCSATISATYNPDGSLLLTANPTTVPPSVVTIYEWLKGTPPSQSTIGGNNSQVQLAAGDWENGDLFTLNILASDGCTATATFTADSVFPTLQLLRDGNALTDGSETTLNTTVGAGNAVITINMAAVSSADINVSSILITDNGGVAGATFTSPTTPFVLANGAPQDIVLTVPRANSGVLNFYITIASDDPNNPIYNLGAKITIV